MARSVALISLHPLDQIGGGEQYTFSTWRSINLAGDHCRLFARRGGGPSLLPFNERLRVPFTEFRSERDAAGSLSLHDLLLMLAEFDVVWIHQFLSSDAVFDVIAAVASDQTLLFTNLGHEVLRPQFLALYCTSSNHFFVEISDYAAERSKCFRGQTRCVTGSIWRDQFVPVAHTPEEPEHKQACALGRVLPHKGLEMTISGLPAMWELNVIGPFGDAAYLQFLRAVAKDRNVRFLGQVSEETKRSLLLGALCLIASSCHETYDGTLVPQAELLGLVVFEAIASGVLPVASDIPSFHEVMTKLGLSRFIYQARDSNDLNRVLRSIGDLPGSSRDALVQHAAEIIVRNYLWDDYWARVVTAIASSSKSIDSQPHGSLHEQRRIMNSARMIFSQFSRDQILAMVPRQTWVHSIDLGSGVVTPGLWGSGNPSIAKALSEIDFGDKKVLDVGCWDGLYSFEAERRGASEVHAIDLTSQRDFGGQPTFHIAHAALESKVFYYPSLSVYDVENLGINNFDVVIFAGVYYHLKDPLRALTSLRRVLKEGGLLLVEGAILDQPGCFARFFYRESFCSDLSNWWVPTIECLRQWVTSSFFSIVKEYERDGHLENQRHTLVAEAVLRDDPLYSRIPVELERFSLHSY